MERYHVESRVVERLANGTQRDMKGREAMRWEDGNHGEGRRGGKNDVSDDENVVSVPFQVQGNMGDSAQSKRGRKAHRLAYRAQVSKLRHEDEWKHASMQLELRRQAERSACACCRTWTS